MHGITKIVLLSMQVVAAELLTEGSKDVVIYKIRVADGSGEWTVSRRFRNFETLHRALRELAAYRLRLPAKRIFSQQHSVEFVEDRRQQLDAYLQALLANPAVAGGVLCKSDLILYCLPASPARQPGHCRCSPTCASSSLFSEQDGNVLQVWRLRDPVLLPSCP